MISFVMARKLRYLTTISKNFSSSEQLLAYSFEIGRNDCRILRKNIAGDTSDCASWLVRKAGKLTVQSQFFNGSSIAWNDITNSNRLASK